MLCFIFSNNRVYIHSIIRTVDSRSCLFFLALTLLFLGKLFVRRQVLRYTVPYEMNGIVAVFA